MYHHWWFWVVVVLLVAAGVRDAWRLLIGVSGSMERGYDELALWRMGAKQASLDAMRRHDEYDRTHPMPRPTLLGLPVLLLIGVLVAIILLVVVSWDFAKEKVLLGGL